MQRVVCLTDDLARSIVKDPLFQVLSTGHILTRIGRNGKLRDQWRIAGSSKFSGGPYYWRIRYQGKMLYAHRIVYQAFIGDLDSYKTINHKDGNGLNNSVDNLELVSVGENNAHRFRVLRHGAVLGNAKIDQATAEKIRNDRENGRTYKDLVKKYRLSKGTISLVINRKIWNDTRTHQG